MRRLTWFNLRPSPASVIPVTLLSTFPHRIKVTNLLHTQPPLQSQTSVTNQSTTKRLKNSPKLPFSRKITRQIYFAAKTRDYNQFAEPIPKNNLQCQYVTNTVTQHQNIIQA